MSYKPLFQISLLHDYYEGNSCSDISIHPTPACEKLLKKHRMLPKVSSTGIQVKTAIDEANGTPLLSLAEGTKLAFVLTIQNPSFSSFTALDGPATGHIHVFSNNTKQATLSHSEISKKDVVVDPMTFALVEIQVTKGLFSNLDQAQKFVIHFKAVEHLWKYYLVASPSNNDYHIESSSMNGLEAITFEKALGD